MMIHNVAASKIDYGGRLICRSETAVVNIYRNKFTFPS
jgi:hypothetical protein